MLPTTFEFRWDAGHMIFFGAFYAVVTVVFTSLLYVAIRSLIDTYRDINGTEAPKGRTETVESSAESLEHELATAGEARAAL